MYSQRKSVRNHFSKPKNVDSYNQGTSKRFHFENRNLTVENAKINSTAVKPNRIESKRKSTLPKRETYR